MTHALDYVVDGYLHQEWWRPLSERSHFQGVYRQPRFHPQDSGFEPRGQEQHPTAHSELECCVRGQARP